MFRVTRKGGIWTLGSTPGAGLLDVLGHPAGVLLDALGQEEAESRKPPPGGKKYNCFRCDEMTPHRDLEPSIRDEHIKSQEAAEHEYERRYHKICIDCEVECRIEEEKDPVKKEGYGTVNGRLILKHIATLERNYKSVKPRVVNARNFATAMQAATDAIEFVTKAEGEEKISPVCEIKQQ